MSFTVMVSYVLFLKVSSFHYEYDFEFCYTDIPNISFSHYDPPFSEQLMSMCSLFNNFITIIT